MMLDQVLRRAGHNMSHAIRVTASAALIVLLTACGGGGGDGGGGGTPTPVTYHASSGIAEKGPLITGSAVTAQELDPSLSPTGKQYSYQITSDLGEFSPTSSFTSQYIGVAATGYYFDEVLGTVSGGPVTLNGYSDLTVDTVMNVNILTTLAYQRIRTLVVQSGKTFSAARTQAEQEVLAALKIPAGSYGAFGSLKLTGNNEGAQILAAISSLFVQGNNAGESSVLINNFQNDLGTDGTLDSAVTLLALQTAAQNADPRSIAQHLNERFGSAGVSFAANDIARWIDGNGDGLVGELYFEVTGADSSTAFTLPAYFATALNGKSIYMNGGQIVVNDLPVTGEVTIHSGDVVAVMPGNFVNGAYQASINSGIYVGVARVVFVAPLDSIEVSPQGRRIAVTSQQAFTAVGHFSDGSVGNLSSTVRWSSSSPQVATVGSNGFAEPAGLGTATITATFGSYSGSSELEVVPVVLDDFTIAPNAMNTGVGVVQKPKVTGSYSDGTAGDVTQLVTWTSNDPLVATVDAHGAITGVALGSTNVEARIDSLTHSFSVNVTVSGVSMGQPMVVARRAHSATKLADGRVLIAGGEGDAEVTAEVFDPATATWSPTGTMANRHSTHEATLLSDGRVFVSGGVGSGPAVPYTEIYDPATNQWSETRPMSLDRVDHTATLLSDGKVLVVGGNGGLGPIHASTVLYDPVTNSWSTRANLGIKRAGHSATRLANGKILVAGGWNEMGPAIVSSLTATAELYDPASDTWTPIASMSHARIGQTATLLPDGRVLVAGGYDQTTPLGAEIYDPDSNTWSPAGAMGYPRLWHSATLLANGTVMVAGGLIDDVGTESNSVESYDPTTNSWSPLASLIVERTSHTATLLNSSAVLIVGGGNETPPYIHNSTELYW